MKAFREAEQVEGLADYGPPSPRRTSQGESTKSKGLGVNSQRAPLSDLCKAQTTFQQPRRDVREPESKSTWSS